MTDSNQQKRKLGDILDEGANLTEVWDQTAPAAEDTPMPAGKYLARVRKGERVTSRHDTPGYTVTFEILDGPYAGRLVWLDLWLTPAAMPRTKRDLLKLGITNPQQLNQPLPSGIRVEAIVVIQTGDTGISRNKVRSFEVLGIDPPETDPFAPVTPAPTPASPATPAEGVAAEAGTAAAPASPPKDPDPQPPAAQEVHP